MPLPPGRISTAQEEARRAKKLLESAVTCRCWEDAYRACRLLRVHKIETLLKLACPNGLPEDKTIRYKVWDALCDGLEVANRTRDSEL